MRRATVLLAVAVFASGCAAFPSFPRDAYFPLPSPRTAAVADAIARAARAAGDDPARYSFALIATPAVTAATADDAVLYVSEGLADLPPAHRDALVAREVAHEVLGHVGQRRALSIGLAAAFVALGIAVPGLGLADFIVNPLAVRAFSREQAHAADRRAVELLGAMGYDAPRRTLAAALRAAARVNGPAAGGLLAVEPALDDRLAALEPLEPPTEIARASTE